MWQYVNQNELYHFGIKGMRWGHRKASYNTSTQSGSNGKKKQLTPEQRTARRKKIAIATTAVVGTALAVYGAKKLRDVIRDKNVQKTISSGSKAVNNILSSGVKPSTTSNVTKIDFPKVNVPKIEVPKVNVSRVEAPKVNTSTLNNLKKAAESANRTANATSRMVDDYNEELLKKLMRRS